MACAEAKAAAVALLLSFSAALFLRGALADLLLSALDGFLIGGGGCIGSLLGLIINKRSMVLLCHAILLLVLRDAGILSGGPARRKSRHQPPGGSLLTADAVVLVAARCTEPVLPRPARAEEREDTKEVVVVEKWTGDDHHLGRRRVHRGDVVHGDRSSVLALCRGAAVAHDDDDKSRRDVSRAIVAHENGKSRGEGETGVESADDDDEMDRRFDKFIADTRRKMQQEAGERAAAIQQGRLCLRERDRASTVA
ncbi:hypothetical protein BAE44_0004164 [Dichanthelium oligosanthes]|uniref:Uncharacterized protein n=1 Tax=Dichanthelium oligosanthes TaxID=888268 RepID=A0A1E5WC74_9POAL|nr:hypothetical protein BAE44_0004164 [Dichanthelium oligosanthes]